MTDDLGGFEAAVCLHEQLLRRPDPEAAAAQLCPGRLDPPTRWTADLHPIRAYQAIDLTRLALAGYDDFHAIPDAPLDAAIEGIVDAEGPVHFDTLADRLLAAADVGRLGSRIRERIEARLQALSATPDLSQRGGFVARPAQFLKPPYRDWREAPEKTRRLEAVSDEELMLALFRAVLDGNTNDAETAMNAGIHAIGFTRLTENARDRLQGPLAALLDAGILEAVGDGLRVATLPCPVDDTRS
ncbi:DUF3320 domain-containing protein [Spiribacter aquaticus]|uniref:DUF3320 domain-containing protein n=1 Tax=Spiribacter aquaticus TaxID=1935996 RepID=A0A557RJH9_9GAMM|nr:MULTISPECIES: DUF3320 domain-containing protein [Spiribacter]KAF0280153.1 hypothetical protein BA897_05410 [Spiribacter roseus]TVO65318.1 DUF3320 domain-containing protein [Spiribacter aquaticus]